MSAQENKMTRINITIPEGLLEEFKKYCEIECRPVSAQIQYLIKQALKEQNNFKEEAMSKD
ncbi:ribbon-helix-helix domain-containing protein [Hyella patelloides]|nr:CopG family transcriptional regulator [Hyella patelloides]